MKVEVLKANKNDIKTILLLQKDCYISEAELYNDYSIPPLQQDLKSLETEFDNSIILKCVINGEIIGSVRGYKADDTSYIGRLIVKKDFQNKGYGRLLVESIESMFKDCKRFELFTGHKSHKNLYLYNKLGYKEFKKKVLNKNLTIIYLEKIKQ